MILQKAINSTDVCQQIILFWTVGLLDKSL